MTVFDYIKTAILILVLLYASISDIKSNIIRNRVLAPVFVIGLLLDCAEVLIYGADNALFILENVLVINAVSLSLFFFHIWGAADAKLTAVASVFVPGELYIDVLNNSFCLSFILVFAFAISYFALIADSVRMRLKIGRRADPKQLAKKYVSFLYKFFCIISYVTLFDQILLLFPIDNGIVFYITIVISLAVVLLISRFKVLQKIWLVLPAAVAGIVIKLIVGIGVFNRQLLINYGVVLIMTLIRLLIQDYNYEEIDAKDVKRGMVLSLQTTIQFGSSKIEGLPRLSKEDLRSRLTEVEAKSVVKWSKSAKGREKVVIVRKMPFAVFISLGVVIFVILGAFL